MKAKWILWTLAGIVGLVMIAVVAGYVYLKSSSFQQFAIRKIIEDTNEATGGRAQVRAFDFELGTLTAHLYGVVIHGKEADDVPPLLQVDKLTVGLKIRSVLRRQVNLSELLIEHPTVHLYIDRNGNSNIPVAPPSNSSGSTNVFDMAVGHTSIKNGEIGYNDRSTPLDADLFDLKTDIRFESLPVSYRGSISYDNGHLQYDRYAPVPHALSASFTATPSLFHLDSAVITLAKSSIKLNADLTSYSDPVVEGKYDIRVHSEDFSDLSPTLNPAGDIVTSGTFHYHAAKDQPLLKSIGIKGQLASEALRAAVSGGRLEFGKLHGNYNLVDGSLRASDIGAEILGGRVSANLDVDHLDSTPVSHVRASVKAISLDAAQHAFHTTNSQPVEVSGFVEGKGDATWSGSVSGIRARVDAAIHSGELKNTTSSSKNIPVEGVIHAIYDGPRNALTVHQTTLQIPETNLTAEGEVSKRSHLQITANAADLHRLITLVSIVHPFARGTPAVAGSATLDAVVTGDMKKPEVSARLNAQNLSVQGSDWKSAGLSIQANSSRVVVSNGTLLNARRGQASFDGTIGLRDWSYLASSPIQAHVSLRQMQVGDLEHLASVQYPVSGEVSATVAMHGSQLAPQGSGSIQITNARAYDEPLKTLALSFHGDDSSIVSDLRVAADAGSIDATLTYAPKTRAYKVQLNAAAIVLQKLRAVQEKNLALQGTVAISANGAGTIDDPQLTVSLQLPKLEVQGKSIVGVKADVRVANKQADLNLDSQVVQASVHARGHIDLTGDYETNASIDTSAIPLGVLLAAYSSGVPEGFSGHTEIHATLKGPLKNKNLLEAHVSIPTLSASYQSLEIEAASPIRADFAHSVITLQPAEIRGTGTTLHLQGSVPIDGTSAPKLSAQGTIDARILKIVSPDLQSSGTVALDIHATGSAANPQVAGQVRLQNISLVTAAAPVGVENLNGTLDVDSERVHITNLSAEVGGGQVSAGGSIRYRPSPQFDVALQAKSVRLRYPAGLRTLLEGNIAWVGSTSASSLNGRVLVDSLSFTPDFDLSTFADQFGGNAAVPAVPGFADTVNLQIAVQSKSNLSANSSQVSIEGTAFLNAGGTLANPVITGRTDLTAGELFYRNVRYQLQRGIITFDDPNETKPTLNVSVATTVEQYNLTLNLRGPLDMLTTSYSSDPPLATADIINLIARGHTSSELAASQSTDSMIASQAASEVGGSIQKLAGISSLQIDPLIGGNNQNPSARLAVQQRVSKNFLFTFSTDVSQPGQEIVQGDYQINKRWSVSVARDQLGGVSVDGRFHTKF